MNQDKNKNVIPIQFTKSFFDHVITIFKASLASFPYAGGATILLDEYLFKSTERAISKSFNMFNERLNEIEDRLDLESVNEDQLSDTIKSFFQIVIYNSHEDKLKAAVNILTNLLLNSKDVEKLSYNELNHFTKCIDTMSVGALEALGVFLEMVNYF